MCCFRYVSTSSSVAAPNIFVFRSFPFIFLLLFLSDSPTSPLHFLRFSSFFFRRLFVFFASLFLWLHFQNVVLRPGVWAFFFRSALPSDHFHIHLCSLFDIDFAIFMFITTFAVRCVLLICNFPFDCCSLLVACAQYAHISFQLSTLHLSFSSCTPLDSIGPRRFAAHSFHNFSFASTSCSSFDYTQCCEFSERREGRGRTFLFFICSY